MDDPLVALTLWQTAEQKKRQNAVNREDLSAHGKDLNAVGRALMNGHPRTPPRTKRVSSRKENKSKWRMAQLGEQKGEEDTCFPCLSGVEDVDAERTRENGRNRELRVVITTEREAGEIEEEEEEECELTESSILGLAIENERNNTPPRDHGITTAVLGDQYCSPVPQPQDFLLMRLFQSKLFDMSIAIGYLFKSKEADVLAYLGNKLFVSLYMHMYMCTSSYMFNVCTCIYMYIHVYTFSCTCIYCNCVQVISFSRSRVPNTNIILRVIYGLTRYMYMYMGEVVLTVCLFV